MKNMIVKPREILLPRSDKADYKKWAVVACDQFSSQPKYWEEVEKLVGDGYSTYKMIFPEAYLKRDNQAVIAAINAEMVHAVKDDVFYTIPAGMVLVERITKESGRRLGIVTCVDLEQYSFNNADCSLIRASEGTILDRIPPRVKIRNNAPLELPHIMLLSDDKDNSAALAAYNDESKRLIYDFELNMGGGRLRGYEITNTQPILDILNRLSSPECMEKSCKCRTVFAFAVGDGNHSLAAAKVCWNNIKADLSEEERQTHPARFALCEINSVYDEGINFHPIHRVIHNLNPAKFIKGLHTVAGAGQGACEVIYNAGENAGSIFVKVPSDPVEAIEYIQKYIDEYKLDNPDIEVDYIHGDDALKELVSGAEDSVGILLPPMDKATFFETIARKGVLPRKSFSMGEAVEKRYYMEAKVIK